MPKMTLDQLQALRPPTLHGTERMTESESFALFCEYGVQGRDPSNLSDGELQRITYAALMAGMKTPDEKHEIAAYARRVLDEHFHRAGSAGNALKWLQRNEKVERTYLVAKLLCPKGKRLADLFCLPESADYAGKSTNRLLVVPTGRGKASALAGDARASRKQGACWWYVSDEDRWDLRCKCCPRPDAGVLAADFFAPRGTLSGYRAVLL
jgi:hypothetical protein